jgi:molybdopterin-guanine dinucleotide biosynthesis protein A
LNPSEKIDGFILAGGRSSRMGRDKARLELDGREFVARIAEALAAISHNIRIVSAPEAARALNIANVADRTPGWGALGGLETAVCVSETDWAAVAACDLPFVTGALFERLSELRENFDAVVPVQEDGRPQPLCALYYRPVCAEVAERLITENERRPRALLAQVKTRWVQPAELADLAGAGRFFLNINTPDDLAQAEMLVE